MITLPLEKSAFRHWLPHTGAMCLLDTLLAWSPEQACCESRSHLMTPHPLAENGVLGCANLVEYAAQAMALHGAILEQQAAPGNSHRPVSETGGSHGVLAGIRRLNLHVDQVQTEKTTLQIRVALASGDARTALYEFTVMADDRLLADGRATVMLIVPPTS